MRTNRFTFFLPALVGFLAGCGGSVSAGPGNEDGGLQDSGGHADGAVDGGGTDTGAADTGSPDGGSIDSGKTDSGSPDSGGLDSAPPPLSPQCPMPKPMDGVPCTSSGLECEYGDAWWDIACDTVKQCAGGAWSTVQVGGGTCTPAPGPNPATCPAAIADVDNGGTCSPNGLECVYPEGVCSCTPPMGGPVIEIDGGTPLQWSCVPDQPGCPGERPPLGSTCTESSTLMCVYQECSYAEQCTGGVWTSQFLACGG
jgi:hypothetical protein